MPCSRMVAFTVRELPYPDPLVARAIGKCATAVLATINPDGSPLAVPMWFVLDDAGPMTVVAWASMSGFGSGFGRIYHKGGNNQRQVELYAEDVPLASLVEQFDTPLYVYSRASLERHWHAFDGALARRPHLVCYAVKANSNLAVLAVLALVATALGGGQAAAADDEKVKELTIWFAREYTVPSQEQIDAFTEKTGITLKVDVQPDDNLFAQLIRMKRAGQKLPDVVHLDGFLRPVVAEAGVVVPIQDVVDQWAKEDPESFAQIYDAN